MLPIGCFKPIFVVRVVKSDVGVADIVLVNGCELSLGDGSGTNDERVVQVLALVVYVSELPLKHYLK